eukprot:489045-Amphidinium_carterae.1
MAVQKCGVASPNFLQLLSLADYSPDYLDMQLPAQAPPAVSSSQDVHIYDQQTLSVLASPEANATLAQDMGAACLDNLT